MKSFQKCPGNPNIVLCGLPCIIYSPVTSAILVLILLVIIIIKGIKDIGLHESTTLTFNERQPNLYDLR